jgi:hypothetical protein
MKTYNYAPDTGIFHAEGLADESPLEPGVFLIPAHATTLKPPKATLPKVAVFKDGKWSVETLPPPHPEPEPEPEPTPPAPLTPAEKLAKSGLTVAELKELLGLAP